MCGTSGGSQIDPKPTPREEPVSPAQLYRLPPEAAPINWAHAVKIAAGDEGSDVQKREETEPET